MSYDEDGNSDSGAFLRRIKKSMRDREAASHVTGAGVSSTSRFVKVKRKALTILNKVKPYTDTAERVVTIAVQAQKMTPMTAVGLTSTALNSMRDWLNEDSSIAEEVNMTVASIPITTVLQHKAFVEAGARLAKPLTVKPSAATPEETVKTTEFILGNLTLTLYGTRALKVKCSDATSSVDLTNKDNPLTQWLTQAYDRVLPPMYEIVSGGPALEERKFKLTSYSTELGDSIVSQTMPMLGAGRCILLNGKPGVGKTTLAEEIARRANLGRVVRLVRENSVGEGSQLHRNNRSAGDQSEVVLWMLHLLNAGVLIVDDIDKHSLNIQSVECLRKAAKLVIFTANNGEYDDVLDGSLVRPGRIDETFTVSRVSAFKPESFSMLTEEEWNKVVEWPIAYQRELAARLETRGRDGMRMEDLEQRLGFRTRSGNFIPKAPNNSALEWGDE